MNPAPVVSIQELDFYYDKTHVLEKIDFRIEAGDFVSVIGPNGGGKTTLLKLMLGQLRPVTGRVEIFGHPPSQVLRRIGYVPQHMQIDPLFPMTTADVVGTGSLGTGRLWGPPQDSEKAAINRAMSETGTSELAQIPFAILSGGQRQRVMIARALAGRPELLLLDEPTASLDPGIGSDLYGLLKMLNKEITIVMVSHDVNVVSQHVNRVFCVNGTLVEHCAAQITGELEQFFPGHQTMRLVRHAHDHSHESVDHD